MCLPSTQIRSFRMKIATAPVNWNSPDVPEYRAWTLHPALLDAFIEAGYAATERCASMPKDAQQLKADLDQRGLRLLGAFVGVAFRDPDQHDAEMAKALEIAAWLQQVGASYLIVADSGDDRRRAEGGHVDPAGGLNETAWRSLAAGLHQLAREVAPLGLQLVFHNHVGTYVETPDEIARLLDHTDPALVGWCLDCGHVAYGGGDTLELLQRYGNRVNYVHIKDVDRAVLERARAEQWHFHTALKHYIFAPLGQGSVGIPEVITALRDHGYDGWLVIEQDTTPDDPTQTARANREYLEQVLARAGATPGAKGAQP
jgi:inosose dehydratase